MTTRRPAFHIAGFPVHVRPGFVVFMLLVVVLHGETPEFGLWLAGLMAVFTLLHELGHALVARAAGARAEISLDFLAGYASFVPSRPLDRAERAAISAAGPLVQITVGIVAYVALGGVLRWPIDDPTPAQVAALWAGPVIGLFNLIPILPFDGGNLLMVAVETVAPRRAKTIMYAITIAIAGGAVVALAATPELRSLVLFAAIPLASVAQMIAADRERTRRDTSRQRAQRAEALAWAADDLSGFTDGPLVPSPWYRAWQQLRTGDDTAARRILAESLVVEPPVHWSAPDSAPREILDRLADLVEGPLAEHPVGDSRRPTAAGVASCCAVLMRLSRHRSAAQLAAEAYRSSAAPELALVVARAAAALGDRPTALAWIGAAARSANGLLLRAAIDEAPELAALRDDPALEDALR